MIFLTKNKSVFICTRIQCYFVYKAYHNFSLETDGSVYLYFATLGLSWLFSQVKWSSPLSIPWHTLLLCSVLIFTILCVLFCLPLSSNSWSCHGTETIVVVHAAWYTWIKQWIHSEMSVSGWSKQSAYIVLLNLCKTMQFSRQKVDLLNLWIMIYILLIN